MHDMGYLHLLSTNRYARNHKSAMIKMVLLHMGVLESPIISSLVPYKTLFIAS